VREITLGVIVMIRTSVGLLDASGTAVSVLLHDSMVRLRMDMLATVETNDRM
jgi:hypothetical protein